MRTETWGQAWCKSR